LSRAGVPARRAEPEQPERPLLLEVQGAGDRRRYPPRPPAELRYLGPGRRIRHDPQAEREGGRADVIAPLDREREADRFQVAVGELPVRGARAAPAALAAVAALAGGLAQRGKQPQGLPVPEHPGRGAQPPCRFGDAHSD
jgi:hypothetical protein